MLNGRVVSPQLAPPLELDAATRPWAPPFDQRSCWKTATRLAELAGFTLAKGSTSALTKLVPDCPAFEQPAYGLGPEITTTALARAEVERPRIAPPTSAAATMTLFTAHSLLTVRRNSSHPPSGEPLRPDNAGRDRNTRICSTGLIRPGALAGEVGSAWTRWGGAWTSLLLLPSASSGGRFPRSRVEAPT